MSETPEAYRVVDGEPPEIAEWDWVVFYGGERLHHLDHVEEQADSEVSYEGRTSCGREGTLHIPGLLTRLGCLRCSTCCDVLGWPRGEGSPKNDDELRPLVKERIE